MMVLILGILGFFTVVTAPFAWYLGGRATKEIKASGISYCNKKPRSRSAGSSESSSRC